MERNQKNYSLELNLIEFEKLVTSIKNINCTQIINNLEFDGVDGTDCKIEIGGTSNSITYKIWSPDYYTKERNLSAFLDACNLILLAAKLNPKEIL